MLEIFLGQISATSDRERSLGLLGIFALCGCGLWVLIRWFSSGPAPAEPWDQEVAKELDQGDCTPLCHHCLAPHHGLANFCPECGAPVGEFTNLLPYPYLFSIGHTLRIGTNEVIKPSALNLGGFLLFALVEYGPFAPIYWFKMLKNVYRPDNLPLSDPPMTPVADQSDKQGEPPA